MVMPVRKQPEGSSGVILRPRLLEKLRQVWSHKLTLINAAPGYGKTTLLEQLASQQDKPPICFTVDERDRDVTVLYLRFAQALSSAFPALAVLPPPQGAAPIELGILSAEQLRMPETARNGELLLLFDDVHVLAGATNSEAWLRALVGHLPSPCHLVISSRVVPDLPFIDMIARREILAVGQEELRFTADEIQHFGQMIHHDPLPPAALEALSTRLEGWPAGVALALQPLPSDFQLHVLEGSEGPEALFDVLARQMLDIQPPALRQFLLISSTLSRLTPELCTVALGCENTNEMLSEIQTQNLFINHATNGLVYHMLFRAFLQKQLAVEQPALFQALHMRAAEWFERHDHLDEAFNHYLVARSFDKAALIAEKVAYAYFAESKFETLLQWTDKLRHVRVEVPKLLYLSAIIYTDRYDYNAAESLLGAAESLFTQREDSQGLADIQLQRALLMLQRSAYSEAHGLVKPLIDFPAGPDNLRGRALNIYAFVLLQTGHAEDAIAHFREALPLYQQFADAFSRSNVLQNLGTAYWRTGDLAKALECLQEVVAVRRSLGGANALAVALNMLGYYYAQLGDYAQAWTTLQEGLNVLARFPNKRYESYLLLNLGDVKRNQGAFNEAKSFYRRVLEAIGDGEPALRVTTLTNLSTLHRWQNDLTRACSLADEASILAQQHTISMEGTIAQIVLRATNARQGNPTQYLPDMARLVDELEARAENYALLHGLALYAVVAARVGDLKLVRQTLQRATLLAEKVGTYQPLVSEIKHSAEIQDFLDENRTLYKTLSRELRRLQEFSTPSMAEEHAPRLQAQNTYQLRFFCLGQTKIIRDGISVDMVLLRRTGRDFVYHLLFEGSATREHLSALFWPESSAQKTRQNFHTTLFRVRQALGENSVILQSQLYTLNSEIDIWCDAIEIERLTHRARLLHPRDARAEDMWQRATNLYQGDFLSDVDAEWAIARRELLHQLYVDALLGLAECARARNDTARALVSLKQASNLEPYREDIHQSILACYAAKGDKQRIVSHLSTLKQMMRRDLGVSPSAETLALAQRYLK